MPRPLSQRIERRYVFAIALAIALIIILSNLLFMFYNRGFYYSEYKKLSLYEETNETTARYATENMLDYLTGNTAVLNDFFSEKEKQHLSDVKNLIFVLKIKIAALFVILGCLCFFFYKHQKKRKFSNLGNVIKKNLFSILIVQGLIMAFLLVFAFLLRDSFDSLFITFHQMFFANNNWLLDPNVDKLILLLPKAFFVHATATIVIRSFFICTILLVIGLILRYFSNKK